jgi:2-oxoisovalerate dehydrogenase E2 component (dihydrolipoyl transacylase)
MDFHLPPVGEGLIEVELVHWLVQPGDAVVRGQGLMEVMSDKATMEVPAPFAGTIGELKAKPGTKVQVGEVVLSYTPIGEPVLAGSTSRPSPAPSSVENATNYAANVLAAPNGQPVNGTVKLPPAAPSVRMLARKVGLDLARIRGSGPHGRILLDDLMPFLKTTEGKKTESKAPKSDFGVPGSRMKFLGLRRKIAEHLVEAKRRIPHYSYIDECDLTDLVRLRHQLREPFAKSGIRLTYLAFMVKAAALALQDVPMVNSTFDEEAGEIVLHDRYHIGIATATPGGLIVPVVKDVDKKDVATIAREIARLGAEARTGKPRLEDLKGGTFTVTSVGGIGGLISTPIVNFPEVGILGIGKVVKRPVYDSHGRIHPAEMCYLSFSFDHRIVDGAVGAAFGNALIDHLRRPATLLLPEKLGG